MYSHFDFFQLHTRSHVIFLKLFVKNSPITFLVEVPAALRAVLLVALWLVQAVGGALPHL